MLTADTETQTGVLAWEISKEARPFFCPECHAPVTLKKGSYRAHHFAHNPPSDCQYAVGETELHRRAKKELYETLLQHPQVTKLQLERPLGEVRPDLSFWLRSTPIAVEVQLSTLSPAMLAYRTRMYHQKGIYVLWTPPFDAERMLDGERYAPHLWEKYLRALYFGRVCYWLRGETLQVVRFDDYLLEVEARSWYESGGEERSAGGYTRYSKRYRTVHLDQQVLLTQLVPRSRKTWSGSGLMVPDAHLLVVP